MKYKLLCDEETLSGIVDFLAIHAHPDTPIIDILMEEYNIPEEEEVDPEYLQKYLMDKDCFAKLQKALKSRNYSLEYNKGIYFLWEIPKITEALQNKQRVLCYEVLVKNNIFVSTDLRGGFFDKYDNEIDLDFLACEFEEISDLQYMESKTGIEACEYLIGEYYEFYMPELERLWVWKDASFNSYELCENHIRQYLSDGGFAKYINETYPPIKFFGEEVDTFDVYSKINAARLALEFENYLEKIMMNNVEIVVQIKKEEN